MEDAPEASEDGTARADKASPGNTLLAVDRERIHGLEEQVELLREQLRLEQERNAELLSDLKTVSRYSPAQERQRPWWRF